MNHTLFPAPALICAAPSARGGRTMNFSAGKQQFRGACLALTSPRALERNCCRENAQIKNRPLARSCDLRASGSASQSMLAQKRAGSCEPGDNHRCPEQATSESIQ